MAGAKPFLAGMADVMLLPLITSSNGIHSVPARAAMVIGGGLGHYTFAGG